MTVVEQPLVDVKQEFFVDLLAAISALGEQWPEVCEAMGLALDRSA